MASSSKPLIIEWPAAERAELEASIGQGIVAVSYVGCEMELLKCRAPQGKYLYAPVTPKQSQLSMRNEEELIANMPIGFARLEGALKSKGQINVDMTIVGEYYSDSLRAFDRKELAGQDCDRATHVIGKLTTGAFRTYSSAASSQGAGASVSVVSAGASTASTEELLRKDGESASCEQATGADKGPPQNCGALLRVEVFPLAGLEEERAATPLPCPPGRHREGPLCVEDSGSSLKTVALVAGFAGLGIGLGSGAWALERKSAVLDNCGDDKQCNADGASAASTGSKAALISTVSMAVGAGAFGLWLLLPDRSTTTVGAMPVPGGASLGLRRTF